MWKKLQHLVLIASLLPVALTGQITISESHSAGQVASGVQALVSDRGGVEIGNVVVTGYGLNGESSSSLGVFSGSLSGMNGGLVLSTGKVKDLKGPNYLSSPGSNFSKAGHPLADAVMGTPSSDAVFLQFDVKTIGTEISLEYLFASEEYPEKACRPDADRFGIFISGPGINGYSAMSRIPTGVLAGQLVTMSTVNAGQGSLAGAACAADASYYMNNPATANSSSLLSADGSTVVMKASAVVQACTVYRITIVIADGADGTVDSGLLIKNGSLSTNSYSLSHSGSLTFCQGQTTTLTAPSGFSYNWKKNGVNLNQTNSTLEVTQGGTYSVQLTKSGCAVSALSENAVVTVKSAPSSALQAGSLNLCAATSGSVTLKASATSGTYAWSNGATSSSIVASTPGDYTLTVTENGCSSSTVHHVIGNTMVVMASVINERCYGQSEGKIIPTVTGKTGPFVYSWTGPVVPGYPSGYSSSLSQLCCLYAGSYTLTITDENQCSQTHTYQVTQPTELFVNATTGLRGSASAAPSGGVAPYVVKWYQNNVEVGTGLSISNLAGGTYTAVVTDANQCTKTQAVTILNGCGLDLSATTTGTSCASSSTGNLDLTVAYSQAPYTVAWIGPSGYSHVGEDLNNVLAGTYQATVSDQDGCSATKSFVIASPPFSVTLSGTAPLCYGESNGHITSNISGGTAPLTYAWSGPNGFTSTSASLTAIAGGTYTVVVTDAGGCSISQSLLLYAPLQPLIIESHSYPVTCYNKNNGQVIMEVRGATAPYSFVWKKDNQLLAETGDRLSNIQAGIYSVTITDSKGCSTSVEHTITQPAEIVPSVSEAGLPKGQALLSATGGTPPYNFSWQSSNVALIKGLQQGQSVYYFVADANNCFKNGQYTPINGCTVAVEPSVTAVACSSGTNGAIALSVTGSTGPQSFTWTGPNGFTATSQNISGLVAGFYTVNMSDAEECKFSNSYLVGQPLVLNYSTAVTNITCYGATNGAIQLNISGGTPGSAPAPDLYQVSWTKDGQAFASTRHINNLGAGSYQATITDLNGCSKTTEAVVLQQAALAVQAQASGETCYGTHDGSVVAQVSGGTAPYAYSWTGPSNYSASTNTISNVVPGTYSLQVHDARGCNQSATAVVTGASSALAVDVAAQTDVTCAGGSNGALSLTVSGGTAPYTYVWKHFGLIDPTLTSASATSLKGGEYLIEVRDANGCEASVDPILEEPETPRITLEGQSFIACVGQSIQLNVNKSGSSYKWYFNETNLVGTSSVYNVSTVAQSGYYYAEVTLANGCVEKTYPQQVTINPGPTLVLTQTGGPHFCSNVPVVLRVQKYEGGVYTWKKDNVVQPIDSNAYWVNSSGTYTAQVTHLGCASNIVSTSLTAHAPFNVSTSSTPSGCPGSATGSVAVTASNAYGAVNYDWQHVAGTSNSSSLNNQAAGTYTVLVSDAATCKQAAQVSVYGEDIQATATSLPVSCYGASNGGITLTTQYTAAPGAIQVVTSCFTGAHPTTVACGTGTALTNNGQWLNVNAGQTYTVPAGFTYSSGGLNLNGGTLVICGTANAQVNFSSGKIVINTGGVWNASWVSISSGSILENHGTFNCGGIGINGTLDNYGAMNGAGQFSTYSGGKVRNNGTIALSSGQGLTMDHGSTGEFINRGTFSLTGSTALSNTSSFTNFCTFNCGDYWTNGQGTTTNNGQFISTGTFGMNSNNTFAIASGAYFSCVNFNINGGTINLANAADVQVVNLNQWSYTANTLNGPATGCARLRCTGTWTQWSPANTLSGNLGLCLNTLVPSNLSFNSPVTTNCSCTPALPPPSCSVTWSNGQSGTTLSNVPAGTYTATVSCGSCQKTFTYAVTQPEPLSVSLVASPVLCNGGYTGSVIATPAGGTVDAGNPYTYTWNPSSASTNTLTGLAAGTYSVVVKDKNNCQAGDTIDVTQPQPLRVIIQCPGAPSCIGASNASLSTNISGGMAPYAYQWTPSGNTPTLTGLPAGAYSVTVTDHNSCTATASYSIPASTNPCQPSYCNLLTLSTSPVASCTQVANGYVTVSVSQAQGTVRYDWLHLAGTNDPANLSNLAPGTYTLKITDLATNCYKQNDVVIASVDCGGVPPACSLQVSSSVTSTCPNATTGAISLQITGQAAGLKIDWDHIPGSTVSEPAFLSGLASGTYHVAVSDANCPATLLDLTVNAPGTLDIFASRTSMCVGQSATLTSSVDQNFTWSGPGVGMQTSRTITVTQGGTYELAATVNGCALTASIEVNSSTTCIPEPLCEPMENTEVVIEETCEQDLQTMAFVVASHEYSVYLEEKRDEFRAQYKAHCLKPTESLSMSYSQKEHHYTLYYYDQAGNLTRTVPPQGVEEVDDQDLSRINTQREADARNDYTEHTLTSTYTYNSLNQLVSQSIPDHDQVELQGVSTFGGSFNNNNNYEGLTFTATGFNGLNGVALANQDGDGLIYLSSDGGRHWSPLSTVTTETLNDVLVDGSNVYVVGDKGVVITSADNGVSWLVKETEIETDLLRIAKSGSTLIAWSKQGLTYTSTDAINWSLYTAATSLGGRMAALTSASLLELEGEGTTWYAILGTSTDNRIAVSTDALNWQFTSQDITASLPIQATDLNGTNGAALAGTSVKFMLRSTDGTSWKVEPVRETGHTSLSTQSIRKLYSVDLQRAAALTAMGDVCATYDGVHWSKASTTLADMQLVGYNGYGVQGNQLYSTVNGGITWSQGSAITLGSGYEFRAVNTLSASKTGVVTLKPGTGIQVGYIATTSNAFTKLGGNIAAPDISDVYEAHLFYDGSNNILTAYLLVNENGVRTLYKVTTIPSNNTATLQSIATGVSDLTYVSATEGQYLQGGVVYATTDGANYTASANSLSNATSLSVSGTNMLLGNTAGVLQFNQTQVTTLDLDNATQVSTQGSTVWLSDAKGSLLSSSDLGQSWTLEKTVPEMARHYDLKHKNNVLSIAGEHPDYGLIVYRSTNAGQNWSTPSELLDDLSQTGTARLLIDAADNTYLAAEGTKVYRVGTSSYELQSTVGSAQLMDLEETATNKLLAVGQGGLILGGSKNGVLASMTHVKTKKMNALDMNSTGKGFAAGEYGVILKITGNGSSFKELVSTTNKELYAVSFLDDQYGLVGGENGTLRYTDNGGQTWKTPTSSFGGTLHGVYQLSTTKAVAVSSNGNLYYTNDMSSWASLNLNAALYAVDFVDQGHGLTGGDGVLYRIDFTTTAPTTTLVADPDVNSFIIRSIRMSDRVISYLAGDNGLLQVSRDGAVTYNPLGGVNNTNDLTNISFRGDNQELLIAGTNADNTPVALYGATDARYTDRFWYDELGRLVISQNAKQAKFSVPGYSYTRYDYLGRIEEVGEALNTHSPEEYLRSGQRSQVTEAGVISWLALAQTKREITKTFYDRPMSGLSIAGFTQNELRGRVSSITYDQDGTASGNGYEHATHYSYDVHGNVNVLIQDYAAMERSLTATQGATFAATQRYKRMEYEYDLISGNVHQVKFQPGKTDQFYHKYEYDADNRLSHVYTSIDGELWDKEARYNYYRHGPLARTEKGEHQVAGEDYFYTLQGWIKGVNANSLYTDRDAGKDGNYNANGIPGGIATATNKHARFAQDAHGYSLGYHSADYTAIGTQSALMNTTNLNSQMTDLFNGNISRMLTTLDKNNVNTPAAVGGETQLTAYRYDQLNRIKELKSYKDVNVASNSFNAFANNGHDYKETFTYDANGNIKTLTRDGMAFNTTTQAYERKAMDAFTYKYDYIDEAKGKMHSNRLYHVNDNTAYTNNFEDDIDDQGNYDAQNENTWNYTYDEIGNLTKDKAEDIEEIKWNVYGKVQAVIREAGSTKPDLEFLYDASGNRVAKVVKPAISKNDANTWITTWYLRDATGNIMGTYKQENGFRLQEQEIYGSSRLGLVERELNLITAVVPDRKYTSLRGYRRYEGSNHLGNVLSVISDKKLAYDANNDGRIDYFRADVVSYQDYYAFGSNMHGRSLSGQYRFGFNGKENDSESGWQDYGMRMYNPALARFFTVDPLRAKYPFLTPYQFASNNPIASIDLDGLEAVSKTVTDVLNEAAEWVKANNNGANNTYKLGAIGQPGAKKGDKIDCSGFMRVLIRKVTGIDPYTDPEHAVKSRKPITYNSGVEVMASWAKSVGKNVGNVQNVQVGDFLILNNGNAYGHIGIVYEVERNDEGKVIKVHFYDSGGQPKKGRSGPRKSVIDYSDPNSYWAGKIDDIFRWDNSDNGVTPPNTTPANATTNSSSTSSSSTANPTTNSSSSPGTNQPALTTPSATTTINNTQSNASHASGTVSEAEEQELIKKTEDLKKAYDKMAEDAKKTREMYEKKYQDL